MYNARPFRDSSVRNFSGGIGICEMLFRCNVLAIVGGGTHPKFPPNKVLLWDDVAARGVGELSFKTKVIAVKLRKDKIVVVLDLRVFVYNFPDLRLIDAIDTCNNPKGLCALNPDGECAILATPTSQKGFVRIALYSPHNTNNIFKAHESQIEAMAISRNGNVLATASEQGSIIKMFKIDEKNFKLEPPFQEIRRG